MEHLTVEEMIDFVSSNELDQEYLSLASKVHAHILRCDECRERVAAYQTVYDEFIRMGREDDYERSVSRSPAEDQPTETMRYSF